VPAWADAIARLGRTPGVRRAGRGGRLLASGPSS
jgi:hypothetical protein